MYIRALAQRLKQASWSSQAGFILKQNYAYSQQLPKFKVVEDPK